MDDLIAALRTGGIPVVVDGRSTAKIMRQPPAANAVPITSAR